MTNKAVFLDKDGTLIEDVPYNVNPDLIRLTVGSQIGVRSLHQAGYKLIIISNQSGVARGYFPELALLAVETRLRHLLADIGVPLTGFYYCPHHLEGNIHPYNISCLCRKPEPGLIVSAAQDCKIDLTSSWFIGDILNDVEAGYRAGCQTVLIDNGNETEWVYSPQRIPDYIATDLAHASDLICSNDDKTARKTWESWGQVASRKSQVENHNY